MSLPEISARLDATIDLFELYDRDTLSCVVVIKQRFTWDDRGRLARSDGATIRAVDEPWPDAESPMFPGDLFVRKPSTDVVVVGHAVSARPTAELDVHVRVGAMERSLRVFGPRVWYRSLGGMAPTPPQSFERLPLMWEHAFGGMDVSDPKRAIDEPRNPYGTGLAIDSATLEHAPAPRIEDPQDLIQNARSRPAPAGVAALPPHAEPRRRFSGTYDQRWQDERMPLFPIDFDERFNQVAAPGLVAPRPLAGDEPIQLFTLGRPGPTKLVPPRLVFQVDARTDRGVVGHRPVLDTVLILADERALEVVHRIAIPLQPPPALVRELRVYEKRVRR